MIGPVHGGELLPRTTLASRPYVAINVVATADGRTAINGTVAGMGSPTDRALLYRLRAEADAVMHGAGTLRAERFSPRVPPPLAAVRERHGLPPQPWGVLIAGNTPLLATHPYFRRATPAWPRLVYAASPLHDALAADGVEVLVAERSAVDLRWVLEDLARRGVRRLVCEGGPRLNASLVRAGLVDELFLTLAPRLAVDPAAPGVLEGTGASPGHLALRSVYERDGELFLRYRVEPPRGTGT